MTKHHYVYSSYEEWGREYIGVRSCNCLPEEDTKYFGSFCDKTFKPTGKTILFTGETRKEAMEIEIELHDFFGVAVNPQFANMAKATSTKFDTTGIILGPRTEEQKKKIGEALSGVPKTEEAKKKMSEAQSGKTLTEETKKKISEANSGEKAPHYGKFGALHHSSKAIIAIKPDGTQLHFGSGHEAARELKMNPANLSGRYLKPGKQPKQGKWKGWQFFYKNP